MRVIGGTLAAAAVAVLATACASSTTSSGPVTPGSSASSSQASGQASAPPTQPASGSSGGVASPNVSGQPKCATSDLQVKIGGSEGAAGSVYVTIDFTNSGSATCTLFGYPGVSLTGGSPPAQIGAAADRDHTKTATQVTLAAGATASAVVQVVQAGNYSASTCDPQPASAMLVYPPDQTASVSLPYSATGCASTSVVILRVSPVTAG